MTRRIVLPVVILAATAALWWSLTTRRPAHPDPPRAGSAGLAAEPVRTTPAPSPATAGSTARTAATEPLPDLGRSELADHLNAANRSIDDDLKAVNEIFTAWLLALRPEGVPIGENREVTTALTGDNRLGMAFVPRDHPAINARGELCDRWGTPFRFHPLSRTQMEIRSAGPDRRFGTPDDHEWAPWPKNF